MPAPAPAAWPQRLARWGAALAAAAGLATGAATLPAPAQEEPETASVSSDALDDRLGLIAFSSSIRERTLGREIWEVWTCRTGGLLRPSPRPAAATLNNRLAPYFQWMSDGDYQPVFTAGGSVTAAWGQTCHEQIAAAGRKPFRPALIVNDRASGSASPQSSPPGSPQEEGIDPTEAATVVINGGDLASLSDSVMPAPGAAARALARALAFPPSFGGEAVSGGRVLENDNSMDVMSGGADRVPPVGTIAVNRYAAGWIDSREVAAHREGAAAYQLSPVGEAGFQMLVIPSRDGPGVFYALGVRVREGYDRGIVKEGVETYRIDQRPTACAQPTRGACWGTQRRTRQVPAGESPGLVRHVHREGQSFELEGVRVEVAERSGNRFTVRVGTPRPGETARLVCGARFAGRFCDEDGSVHEGAIEKAADWGITVGCERARFCPDETITRRQMAAFLYRAARWNYGPPAALSGQTSLGDVPFNAWYRPFAEWAVETGVMSAPFGEFAPGRLVTRGEMAEMLTAAFEHLSGAVATEGLFADMTDYPVRTVRAAEGLYKAGVAKGCSTHPRQFCPERPVTRAQMASFLVRALET